MTGVSLPDRRGVLLGGASALTSFAIGRSRFRDERPNLVVITSDQQHWEAMGYEDPFFRTPACDALAAEGVVFRQSYCTTPQCSPSRSSMMTGFYPHKTGVKNNHGQPGDDGLQKPTVGLHLQRAGYHTAYHGKWHLGNTEVGSAGWDTFRPTQRPSDRAVTRMTHKFLGRAKTLEQPFALFVMFLEPHGILGFEPSTDPNVPEDVVLGESFYGEDLEKKPAVQREFLERAGVNRLVGKSPEAWREYRADYRERVAFYDRQVGSVVQALQENGLWENTVVLLTSDHGDMDTHHGLVFKGPFMYEHLVRVPTLIRLPAGLGGQPRDLDHFAWVNVDLTPTLLDLAGAPPLACDGSSAVPLLRGEEHAERARVVGQFHGKGRWVHPIRMLRTQRHKYTRDIVGAEELYDLERDPHELVNLASAEEHAGTKAELRSELGEWMEAEGDPFERLDPATGEQR